MESESVDFSVFSPPFASLYTYSNSDRDMGNVKSHAEFWGTVSVFDNRAIPCNEARAQCGDSLHEPANIKTE